MPAEGRKEIQVSYLSKLFYKGMEHCLMDLLCFHGTRSCVWTKDGFFFLTALVHQKCNIDLYLNLIGTYLDISPMEATVTEFLARGLGSPSPNTLG